MKKLVVRAPMRIDLAGGTTDIPPLFLFHYPAPVINSAINIFATVTIEASRQMIVRSMDQEIVAQFRSRKDLNWGKYPQLELIIRIVKAFDLKKNVLITVSSGAPRGSGLGASSSLAIALVTGLSQWMSKKISSEEVIHFAKSLETQTINVPTGYQDYWGAMYGGLHSYQIDLMGAVMQRPIRGLKKSKKELEKYLHVIYTGTPHFSGTNNWQLLKNHIDGDKKTVAFFERLRENAMIMEKALDGGSIKVIAQALNRDWETRKAMLPGMSTPSIEKFTKAFFNMGGMGFRVCGAGGGGCAVALIDPRYDSELSVLIKKLNMKLLPVKLVEKGVSVERL
jgi:D-glycero-alpha-D-manno-heptose-7-phosphate kinase